jgi:hypothetical protein
MKNSERDLFQGAYVLYLVDPGSREKYGYLVNKTSQDPEVWKVMLLSEDTDIMKAKLIKASELQLLNQKQFITVKKISV